MQLYQIHTKILKPFVDETIKALASMAGLEAKVGQGYQEDVDKFNFKGYAVCVVAKTYGAIEGKVIMHHNNETALAIGNRVRSRMLGEASDESEINDSVGEALTEFSNTVVGMATRFLSEKDMNITFTPPLYIADQGDSEFLTQDVQEILTVPIEVKGIGQFTFSYLLHKKTEAVMYIQLYHIHSKVLKPFVDEAVKALASMADLEAKVGRGYIEDVDKFNFKGYAVCVVTKIYGAVEGKVIMHSQTETALAIGNRVRSKMLGVRSKESEINEDVSEALTEFSNTVVGLATRVLGERDLNITFTPPLYISRQGESDFLKEDVSEILTVPVDVKDMGQFTFSYLLHRKTE